MELRHLRYFVAVAEELNFRRAAQRLNVSQPPLTTQIKQLEHVMGVQLFERNKQRVLLTPAGRELLRSARRIFDEISTAKQRAVAAASGIGGELRVGYTESAIHVAAVSRALHAFRVEHPSVVLTLCQMKSTLQIAAIERGELDAGLMWNAPDKLSTSIDLEDVLDEPLVIALPHGHRLADTARPIAIAELAAEAFVTVSRDGGTLMVRTLTRLCQGAGFTPEIVHEAADLTSSLGLVASGAGISVVPGVMSCFRSPGVTYAAIADPAARLTLHWAARHGASLALARQLRATFMRLPSVTRVMRPPGAD